jgi:uncharacterized protein with HEPN domain
MLPEDHDDLAYVSHMLERARKVRAKVAGKTWPQFKADEDLRAIVERHIEVIGEAARHVSPEFRAAHPEVPWSDTVAMRHKIARDYFEVIYEIVWAVATEELPKLEDLLAPLVDE